VCSDWLKESTPRAVYAHVMNAHLIRSMVSLVVAFGLAFPAWAQVVRIQFTSEVTTVTGSLLPGVSVGSIITGQVQVDLTHLPPDSASDPQRSSFWYYGGGIPGYIFEFDAGSQHFTLDSSNAAEGLGIVPAIDGINADDADVQDFVARNAGSLYGAHLRFADYAAPFTLLSGDYFPEDLNLPDGLANATFTYSDFLNPDAVIAKVTSASLVIEQETPCALLLYRVNASALSSQRKRPLLATLEAADAAFAAGQCEAAFNNLRTFQNKVRAQVTKTDPVLAEHLLAGSQEIIEAGCAGD